MTFAFFPPARRTALLASTAIGIIIAGAPLTPSRANPTGGTVVRGEATVSTAPGSVTVHQTTDRAVIDWQDFSVGSGESTTFVQPGRGSVTLNRVTGDDASVIDGKLTANGNVFLVNRNGVLVGAGAQVDVGGLVATTSDIADDAFMAGSNRFDRPTDNPNARIVNEGRITVADQGIAALVGPTVANNGVIAARLGTVALGSAETFTVDLAGDGLISFDTGQTVDRATGSPQVANGGTISAAGGTIVLDARQASSVVDRAIDMTGVIEAGGISTEGGTVVLSGGAGTTAVSGTIDVSGTTGGTIEVTGRQVAVAGSATLDASGANGGGTVRLGGGPRGTGSTPRAETTTVAAGARIDVSATGRGDGGTIAVWSDKATDFAGTAHARGGAAGGDGGLIETSSAGKLDVEGAHIDASASAGKGGEWLLDPADVAIVNRGSPIPADGVFIPAGASLVSIDSIFDVLKTGTNVSIVTNDPAIKGDGNISYLANAAYDLGGVSANLRLEAAGAIDWSGTLQVSNGTLSIDALAGQGMLWSGTLDGAAAALTLRATAGGSIKIFDGKLIADTIDLRGCMTGAGGCGTDADPYGIGIQPTASGTSGSVPSVLIDADRLTLLGGLGGIGIDFGADPASSISVAVGSSLHMQGYGFDPFHIGNGVFAPATTATVLITAAFRNSDLGALVGAPAGTEVPGLSETELAAMGGFQSLTLRTGAASATFDADEASGSASVLIGAAVPGGVSFDLPLDIFVEVNDGGDFYMARDVSIGSGGNVSIVTSSPSSRAALLGATTLSGNLTIQSSNIILGSDLDIGNSILLDGNVAIAAPAIAITAGTGLDISGTLDGWTDSSTTLIPDVTMTAKTGSVRIGGDAGFGIGLGSLAISADVIELAGVSTVGDQSYAASSITLFGRGSGDDYHSASGDITVDGKAWLGGNTDIVTDDGDIHLTRDIRRLDSESETALTLTAGGATGQVLVDGDIGNVEGLLDRLTVSATQSFTLHDVLTSGDQTYTAPLGRFFGETYRSITGNILAAATDAALVSGPTLFDAGRRASFGKVDSSEGGFGGLTVTARNGNISFFGDLGGVTRLSYLTAKASERITAANIATSGDAMLFAPDIAFTGATYDAGGAFIAHGAMTIERDLSITGHDIVDLNGTIDLASASDAGLTVGSTTDDVLIGGDVGGMVAIGYLTVTAAGEISVANAATAGDQLFAASRVNLGGSTYAAGGAFGVSGEAVATQSLAITAGSDMTFDGSLDTGGDTIDIVASAGGNLTIFGPFGSVNPFGTVDLTAVGVAAIGAVDAVGSLTVSAGDHIHLLDGHVAAGGDIDLRADVLLAQDAGIVSGGDVVIRGRVDGDGLSDGISSLDIAGNGGSVRVDGAIGGESALLNVTITAPDHISVGNVTTEGRQLYDAAVTLLGGRTYSAGRSFTVTGTTEIADDVGIEAGGDIRFGDRIDAVAPEGGKRSAAPALTADAGGDLSVAGDIGSVGILDSIDLSAAGEVVLHSATVTGGISVVAGTVLRLVDSTLNAGGNIALTGAVRLLGDAVMIAGESVSIRGTVDADSCEDCLTAATPDLDIEAMGNVEVTGAIGADAPPGDIWIRADGTIDVASMAAAGSIFMQGSEITLNGGRYTASEGFSIQGDTLLTRATTVAAGGDIDFGGTIDMLPGTDGGDSLPTTAKGPVELISRRGNVTLAKAVGAADALGSLLVSAADEIFLTGGVWTDGGQSYEASRVTAVDATLTSAEAGIAIDGDLEATGDIVLQAATDIDIAGTIDSLRGEGAGLAHVGMTAGREIRLLGAIGQSVALGSFELVAGVKIDPLSVTTFGDQSYSAPIIVLSGDRYETNGGDFITSGSLSLTAPSVAIVTTGGYADDGDILFEGTTEGADVTLDAGAGSITGSDVAFDLLTVMSTTGTATMGGSLGGITGLEAAAHILRPDGVADTYLFNDCVMATRCGGPPPPTGGIDPEGTIRIAVPPTLALPLLAPAPLIVLETDDPLDDPRFVLSNTGKDALWRLDLLLPEATKEGGQ